MSLISPSIEQYIHHHSGKEDEILYQLYRETHLKIMHPRMLSGHVQGQFLQMLSALTSAKSILEIGTYTGYSAICMGRGMHPDGILHTIDIKEELYEIAHKYFTLAGLNNRIRQYTGDALEIIPQIEATFDLIFIDADKCNYPQYFDLVADKLEVGGLLVADNVLWSGKVVEEADPADADTQGVLEFNRKVQQDSRFQNVLLPLRDGLMLARKMHS